MTVSPLVRRLAALALLIGAVLLTGSAVLSTIDAYVDGQREIADKQAQLRNLHELADSRAAFDRLVPKKTAPALILPADADAGAVLQGAITHAADGQQVIVDGIDALPPETVTRTAVVHLRGTQAGLYAFLKALDEDVPYLVVPRLEVMPSRSADPEHGKPFIVSADLRLAVLVAPAATTRRAPPPPVEPIAP